MIFVRLSFSRAFWLVSTTKVYSGVGADIVMESNYTISNDVGCVKVLGVVFS
jgi:hypothetical protein